MDKWIEFGVWVLLLILIVPFLGRYLAFVYGDLSSVKRVSVFSWGEQAIYRLCRIDSSEEMTWSQYLTSICVLYSLGIVFLFLLQIFQGCLPLNPENIGGVAPALAFQTAVSFVTNTNWQEYAGEKNLSYLTQMLGITVQHFLSASTGVAVLFALIRGITRAETDRLGNFWVDITRTIVYLLLPLACVFSLVLISQGAIQNFHPYVKADTLSGYSQIIPMGPVASQVAIKELGSNGGGFFGANSMHPFENPTPLSNFLQTFSIVIIPAALVFMYGILVKSKKQAFVLLATMSLLFAVGLAGAYFAEHAYNPSMEIQPLLAGKEIRCGVGGSVMWAVSTTAIANGSVNCAMSSLSPLAGGLALLNMMMGEVIFGGLGVGLCGMIMFVLLTVFLSGLMTGRTPEYLGKKIGKEEMQWVMLAILAPGVLILLGSSVTCFLVETSTKQFSGPHGLSEILYAFSSCAVNNGSSFAVLDLSPDVRYLLLAAIMLLGRLVIITASLAIAGLFSRKHVVAPTVGTLPTDTPLFGVLLVSVLLVVAALTFFPALSLGPIIEHLLMMQGRLF